MKDLSSGGASCFAQDAPPELIANLSINRMLRRGNKTNLNLSL
jgi:hypothetical protein